MKTIVFIVPYFTCGRGKFPDMFSLWLSSCANNKSIDWYVFTDCAMDEYYIPSNVKVVNTTFEKVKERIQRLIDLPIQLDTLYKLCDFRHTYREAFQDYVEQYDYWGFCDIDLIWGKIRKFITDDVLSNYDRILTYEHRSIY